MYNPGIYEAKVNIPARIFTKITVDDDKIVDVDLRSLEQKQPIDSDLVNEYKGQIIKAQSVNIDGITGASILTKAVKYVVGEALAKARKK